MAISSNQRNYNLTDADLCMFTSNLCIAMTSDLSDLSAFGITNLKITALKALGDAFEVFPSDEVLVAYITGATEEKNAKLEEVKEAIRNMAVRCQMKWGADSWQEKSLNIDGMNNISDEALLVASRRTFEQMTKFLPDLGDTGLTQLVLDDFEDLNESFEAALNDLKNKIVDRDKKTRERIAKGNELYALVSTYCEIGKRVYAMSDPARYNQYIIYSPGPGTLTAPEDLSFYFPGTLFSWSPVENATSYILQASTDGVDFFEIFSGAETEFVYIPVQTGWMWFRCRAHNDGGNGNWSTVLKNGYYPGPTLPAPSNLAVELVTGTTDSIQLTFSEVPSTTVYKIYRSTANIGDVAGSFVYAGQSNLPVFIETIAAAGHRFYYRCTAENPYQASGNSSQVWIDIA